MIKCVLSKIIIFLLFVACSRAANRIFEITNVFHSQYCFLGYKTPGTTATPCTTATPQTGIIRTAVAITEYSKPSNAEFRIQLSVSYVGDPASVFNINLIYQNPVAGMNMGVFLVVIKTQSNGLYVDLINYKWPGGTIFDNYQDVYKSQTKQFNVSQDTIFTSGTSGLIAIPFASYWKFRVPNITSNYQWQLFATLDDPFVKVQVIFANTNKVQGFGGFVLLFNQPQIAVGISKGWKIGYFTTTYQMGNLFNFTDVAMDFGPKFDPKCIIGLSRFKFMLQNTFEYTFGKTAGGNYSTYKQVRTTTAQQWGNIFCFGNNSYDCSELHTYVDPLDNLCYTAETCPLPVFTGWASTTSCPMCIQQVCQLCDVSDRLKCSQCKPNTFTHLSGTLCVCDTNYYEFKVPIDSASQGLWNNLTPSLDYCKFNCSAVIPGCLLDDCLNSSFCTICSVPLNYVLLIVSSNVQTCVLCNVKIPNCLTCTDSSYCAVCMDGFYLLTGTASSSCPSCSSTMLHCTNCSDANTCTVCQPGYLLNGTTKKCDCNIAYNSLPNCVSCIVADKCNVCVALYFLNSTTSICQPCSDIHSSCTDCSGEKTCISCASGFALDSISIPGYVSCKQCGKFINNCTLCSSSTVCTDCDYFYGINATKCALCDALVMPGCQACETSSLCLKCNSTTKMINNICRFCNEINKCQDCIVSAINTLTCTQCISGFFLQISSVTNVPECKPCYTVCNFCQDCSGPTQCTSCKSPYLIGPTGICDQCETGYQFMQGFCIKQAGCISLYITSDGKSVCLACLTEHNFVLDTKLKKCVCGVGYREEYTMGSLMRCVVNCGDGLVQIKDQSCDDGNKNDDDGCSSECQVEQGFECSAQQPSKCILVHDVDSFEYSYALRVMPQNRAKLVFKISPAIKAFAKIKWQKMITLSFYSESSVKLPELIFSYSFDTNELLVDLPYYETLEDSLLQTTLKLDSTIIKSKRQYFLEGIQLKGRNAPLLFEQSSMLDTQGNISIISTILIVLLLLQFYAGSYTHKMIGLQTIQVIQTIYFSRMIVSSTSTSLLQSINSIQYSATGYHNAQVFLGSSVLQKIQAESYESMNAEFSAIKLQKFFLLNINFTLAPIFIAVVVFMVRTVQKIAKRNKFIDNKLPEVRTQFTQLQRSAQSIYDRFVFPYVMMINMACFFSNIMYFTSFDLDSQNQISKPIQSISFPFHALMLLGTLGIYSYQAFVSYQEFRKYRMTQRQRQRTPKSQVEKLEHDENYPDRANYHPLYVLIYSLFYLFLQFSIVIGVLFQDFNYRLEMILAITGAYFLLICVWKPYHPSVNSHNHFLKLNHGTVVLFLGLCYAFQKFQSLPPIFYIASMYAIMVLLTAVMIGGFVRIFIERAFRKQLQQDSSLLKQVTPQKDAIEVQENKKQQAKPLLPKNFGMLQNNPYALNSQLKEISKKYIPERQHSAKLTTEQENYVIEKIREEQRKIKQQHILRDLVKESGNFGFDDIIFNKEPNEMDNLVKLENQNTEMTSSNDSARYGGNQRANTVQNTQSKKSAQQNNAQNDLLIPQTPTRKNLEHLKLSNLKKQLRMELKTAFI